MHLFKSYEVWFANKISRLWSSNRASGSKNPFRRGFHPKSRKERLQIIAKISAPSCSKRVSLMVTPNNLIPQWVSYWLRKDCHLKNFPAKKFRFCSAILRNPIKASRFGVCAMLDAFLVGSPRECCHHNTKHSERATIDHWFLKSSLRALKQNNSDRRGSFSWTPDILQREWTSNRTLSFPSQQIIHLNASRIWSILTETARLIEVKAFSLSALNDARFQL